MISNLSIDRKEFFRTCGAICLSTFPVASALVSCKSIYYAQQPVVKGKTIEISRKEFDMVSKKGEVSVRHFILIELPGQSHPIYLFRRSDTDYSAVLMKCTHQGNELNAHNGYLTCPAHGSEYDANGKVTEGPAEKNLMVYRVTADIQFVTIHIG